MRQLLQQDTDPSSELPETSDPTTTDRSNYYIHDLPIQIQHRRELLLAHINTLKIKAQAARGKHWQIAKRGGRGKSVPIVRISWDSRNPVAICQAMKATALHQMCPGLLLNTLIEFPQPARLPAHLYKLVCRKFLGSADDTWRALTAAKYMYDAVAAGGGEDRQGKPRASPFLAPLWNTDNLVAAKSIIESLVTDAFHLNEAEHPDTAAVEALDSLIAVTSTQLMHVAFAFGDRRLAYDVFHGCHRWLKDSLVAYSMLMHQEARVFNMPAISSILRTMRTQGVAPDPIIWTDIMDGMCRNGRHDLAKKLFSLHMLFLPHERDKAEGAGQSPNTLYVPSVQAATDGPPNIWMEWFTDPNPHSDVDSFVWSWMQELAEKYHADPSSVVPWLPTMATHRIFLKHLFKAGRTTDATEYYRLLRKSWMQYSQWVKYPRKQYPNDTQSCGLSAIERLVHGCLAQSFSNVRDLYGLGPAAKELELVNKGSQYYRYCGVIMKLAMLRPEPATSDPPASGKGDVLSPEQTTYSKTIREYSRQGDMHSILHHMLRVPWLNDATVWTSLVQCICTQVVEHPDDPKMAHPRSSLSLLKRLNPKQVDEEGGFDWLHLVFDIAAALASKGMAFTHVTYGSLVQACVQMEDFGKVTRIIDHMQAHSYVRFTPDMLRMVLSSSAFDLHAKWELIKGTFGIDSIKSHSTDAACSPPPRFSTVHPDRLFLSFVLRLAEAPKDFELLREIVSDFDACFGVRPMPADYDWAIRQCRAMNLKDEHNYWIQQLEVERSAL
ncbi:hypothetical protein IW140_003880 [Coemansia sp. RSA 1813]|nr:hypothetical protein EV178_004077 [Coemansia sp. RSA 1646]KAJ2568452.1 hypothetical protein IW140_003880 [Coemansia sp. RSA 1813]